MSIIRVAALALALAAPALLPTTLTAAELKLDADLGQTVLSTSKPGSVFLRLNLKSLATAKSERRTPVNVAIVIDRSGSMQGDRIAAAKEGARVALKRLSSDDIVSLVSYNHDVDVLSPAAPLRDSRDKLIEAIDNLRGVGHHRALRRRPGRRPAGREVRLRQQRQPRHPALGRPRQRRAVDPRRAGRARPQARFQGHLGQHHRPRPRLQRGLDAAPRRGLRRQPRCSSSAPAISPRSSTASSATRSPSRRATSPSSSSASSALSRRASSAATAASRATR